MQKIKQPNISFRFTASNERIKGMIDAVLVIRYRCQYAPVKLPIRIHKRFLAKNKTNTYRLACESYTLYSFYKEALNEVVGLLDEYSLEYDAKTLKHELERLDVDWSSPKLKPYVTKLGQLIN